jgi:hypothetical protein
MGKNVEIIFVTLRNEEGLKRCLDNDFLHQSQNAGGGKTFRQCKN